MATDYRGTSVNDTQSKSNGLPNLSIVPGTPVALDFASGFKKVKSTLLGYSKGDALIVRLPLITGIEKLSRVGETVVVRFIWKGVVFGFTTTIVDRHVRGPLHVLFLEWPAESEKLCLRRDERIPCHFPAEVVVGGDKLPGVVIDISTGGVRFYCAKSESNTTPTVQLDQDVSLQGYVVGMEGLQHIRCIVRYIILDDASYVIGLKFSPEEKDKIDIIERYTRRVLRFITNMSQLIAEKEK